MESLENSPLISRSLRGAPSTRDRSGLEQHWDKGAVTRAELVESRSETVVKRWQGELLRDSKAFFEEVKAAAREYCRKSPKDPWVVLDTYGGFQFGEEDEEPFHDYWWSPKHHKWLKVKFQKNLHEWLHVTPEAVERQIKSGRFRQIEVKAFANSKKVVTALEAEGVESFEKWLREKNGGELPKRRWSKRWYD
ncbi:MAG TPA: hypothetical protein VEY88_17950 [Archangium sp.]|nr:hypothetical protein [Archangium sp.]